MSSRQQILLAFAITSMAMSAHAQNPVVPTEETQCKTAQHHAHPDGVTGATKRNGKPDDRKKEKHDKEKDKRERKHDKHGRRPDGVTGATQRKESTSEKCKEKCEQTNSCPAALKARSCNAEKKECCTEKKTCDSEQEECDANNKKSCCQAEAADESYEFNRFRVGGYGEMVAAFKDYGTNRFYGHPEGNPKDHRATISIPRFVLALDYKFSPKWLLSAEVEFESGGTGQAVELENTENGEYETELEKGGEVAIEQFHLTRLIHRAFNLRAGHMIVPVGITNAHHEPMNFFGTVRPEGETTILPSTWHETGISVFGSFGKRAATFNYQAMVLAGLNANGFDRNTWVAGGKQGFFEEDNFNSPAYVGRLDWVGIKGLRVGTSFYYCHDTGSNSDKTQTYASGKRATVSIFSADAQYIHPYFTARTNFVHGHLSNSDMVSAANRGQSNKSPYTRTTPIAAHAVSYAGEVGFHLRNIFRSPAMPDLRPFVRYEYYNPQEKVVEMNVADTRLKTSMWVAGLNYNVGNGIIVKADYTTRSIGSGTFNSENEFALGVAFNGWFFNK